MRHNGFINKIRPFYEHSAPGENQRYLKQISVHQQLQLALLQLHKAFGNVQTQSAAFRITGSITPDKPFHQLVSADIELFSGNIF